MEGLLFRLPDSMVILFIIQNIRSVFKLPFSVVI